MKELVALVTGAASGIGKAVSHKLASRGISVVLADMDEARGLAVGREIQQKYQVRAQFQQVNVAREAEVKNLVAFSASLTGRLDYAANCAGIAEGNRDEEESINSEWFDK
jgi:NAD(P)-dependent dehydrogenase (short-subunit alcohol dehydrogenase family)